MSVSWFKKPFPFLRKKKGPYIVVKELVRTSTVLAGWNGSTCENFMAWELNCGIVKFDAL